MCGCIVIYDPIKVQYFLMLAINNRAFSGKYGFFSVILRTQNIKAL